MTRFNIDLVPWGDEQKSSWLFALLMPVSRVGEAQRILIHCTIFLMKWIESVQLWCTNEGLCSGSHEREMGREWVWFVFLSDYEFLMWQHTCAVSACKYEPFDCTVVSSPWLEVVQPIRTQGKLLFYILVRREHSPTDYYYYFSFSFFWTGQEFICLEINYVTLLQFQCMQFYLFCIAMQMFWTSQPRKAQTDNRMTGNKIILPKNISD